MSALATASLGVTTITFPLSVSVAASSIPWLTCPRIWRGARFTTTTICLPTIVCGSATYCRNPAQICRCSLPRSICKTSNLSAFGCGSHFNTVATRNSSFAKSSYVMVELVVAAGVVAGAAGGDLRIRFHI